jgi:hypothetical protein
MDEVERARGRQDLGGDECVGGACRGVGVNAGQRRDRTKLRVGAEDGDRARDV